MTLEELLEPVSATQFLARFWEREFMHVEGRGGKFDDLCSWDALSRILEEHRFAAPRLRLVRNGVFIPTNVYQARDGRTLPQGLLRELDLGATLVINYFDEAWHPLSAFSASLERVFRCHVNINLYAGWRTDCGFDSHYDPQDNFILQLAGRKHWSVWRPTRAYPARDDVGRGERPTEAPLWDGDLQAGSVLYVPRGWWHVATPLNEPTLHLTVTVNAHTGVDLVRWIADQLRNHDVMRRNLPVVQSAADRERMMEEIRATLVAAWTPDVLNRFLADTQAREMIRPQYQFPALAVTPEEVLAGV